MIDDEIRRLRARRNHFFWDELGGCCRCIAHFLPPFFLNSAHFFFGSTRPLALRRHTRTRTGAVHTHTHTHHIKARARTRCPAAPHWARAQTKTPRSAAVAAAHSPPLKNKNSPPLIVAPPPVTSGGRLFVCLSLSYIAVVVYFRHCPPPPHTRGIFSRLHCTHTHTHTHTQHTHTHTRTPYTCCQETLVVFFAPTTRCRLHPPPSSPADLLKKPQIERDQTELANSQLGKTPSS